jgi:hypothetical protein
MQISNDENITITHEVLCLVHLMCALWSPLRHRLRRNLRTSHLSLLLLL